MAEAESITNWEFISKIRGQWFIVLIATRNPFEDGVVTSCMMVVSLEVRLQMLKTKSICCTSSIFHAVFLGPCA